MLLWVFSSYNDLGIFVIIFSFVAGMMDTVVFIQQVFNEVSLILNDFSSVKLLYYFSSTMSEGVAFYSFCSIISTRQFSILHHRSQAFIGPHAKDVLSILVGSLLGDLGGESRPSARCKFWQSSVHAQYLLWLHGFFSTRGYCAPTIPKSTARKLTTGQYSPSSAFFFWTYSFGSLNWLFDAFYVNGIKCVPRGTFL